MSTNLNYRTSEDKKEILDRLFEIKSFNVPVLIWQNDGKNRKITKFKIINIDQEKNEVSLQASDELDLVNFKLVDQTQTIYFRGEFNNLVFKQDQFQYIVESKLLIFKIPDQVKLIEKRNLLRIKMKSLKRQVSAQIELMSSNKFNTKTYYCLIVDFSYRGLSLIADKKFIKVFFVGEKIKIHSLGKQTYPRPIYGHIKHITDDSENEAGFIFGVELASPLSTEELLKIKSH